MISNDVRWMRKALRLAIKGRGLSSPNPMVGAIIVKGGSELSSGWHQKSGEEHAEIRALKALGANACGATLYVTLEPCNSIGRTPPCTDAIITAGIQRVCIASKDPNPVHYGKGIAFLREHGIQVDVGVERQRAQELNEAFTCWIRYKRPYVVLKMASTLDGKIATYTGQSKWISSEASRQYVQKLRQWADAILVGGETIRQDNPRLTIRRPKNWQKQPLRLIASRSKNLGEAPKVLQDNLADTRVISCNGTEEWRVLMQQLGQEGITALFIEGGGELAAELLAADLIDKFYFFIAPLLLGGQNSRPLIGGEGPSNLAAAKKIKDMRCIRLAQDYLMTGYLSDVHRFD